MPRCTSLPSVETNSSAAISRRSMTTESGRLQRILWFTALALHKWRC